MKPEPLVSVIIPCYNHSHFLGEAINSVQVQTYPNVEVIVVDDGSKDNTAEVARIYPQVKYVRQENQGLSAARNTGMRESTGDYVVFLDADDWLLPKAIEVGIHCFSEHPECAFIAGSYKFVDAARTPIGDPVIIAVDKNYYEALLEVNYIGMHATVMYRKDVLTSVNGFDTALRSCEDYDVYLRIASKYPIFCHQEIVADYRRHGSNMSYNDIVMLKTSLQVLRKQIPNISGSKRYRQAYGRGIKFYKRFYGYPLFEQLISKLKSNTNSAAAFGTTMSLLLIAPEVVFRSSLGRIKRKTLRAIEQLYV